MGSVPVKAAEGARQPRAVTESEIIVYNIEPSFPTQEERDAKTKEISQALYSVFSKYQ